MREISSKVADAFISGLSISSHFFIPVYFLYRATESSLGETPAAITSRCAAAAAAGVAIEPPIENRLDEVATDDFLVNEEESILHLTGEVINDSDRTKRQAASALKIPADLMIEQTVSQAPWRRNAMHIKNEIDMTVNSG